IEVDIRGMYNPPEAAPRHHFQVSRHVAKQNVKEESPMKRSLFCLVAIAVVLAFVPALMHAQAGQPKTFSNAKPMTFGYNMKTYYLVQRTNIVNTVDAVPEDKFFALPPGCTKETCEGEQSSIGAEIAHMIDAQDRMCTIMLTGKNPPASSLGGTVVMK